MRVEPLQNSILLRSPCKSSRRNDIRIASLTISIGAAAMRCCKGGSMSRYKVMVDDNFHYMEEDERDEFGTFSTIEEAVASCKRIVDDDLSEFAKGKTPHPTSYTSIMCRSS